MLARGCSIAMMLLFLLGVFSRSVSGQSKADFFIGYSYTSSGVQLSSGTGYVGLKSTGRTALNGWDISASARIVKWLRVMAEVAGGYGSVPMLSSSFLGPSYRFESSTNLHTYLLGPRLAVRLPKVTPFGEVLFGVARQSIASSAFINNTGAHDSAFAFEVGGGLDFPLVPRIAGRVQANYLQATLFGATQHDPRVSTGLVFRF